MIVVFLMLNGKRREKCLLHIKTKPQKYAKIAKNVTTNKRTEKDPREFYMRGSYICGGRRRSRALRHRHIPVNKSS